MKRSSTAAVLLTLCIALGCGSKHIVDASALEASSAVLALPIDFDRPDYDAIATAIEQLTNSVRAEHQRQPLKVHRVLRKAAGDYARKMVDEGFLAHDDPNDATHRTPQQRVAAAGAKNPSTAENIADVPAFRVESGEPFYVLDPDGPVLAREPDGPPIERHTYASFAATVVEGWMNSPGHRRNLLADDALEVGVGARIYPQNSVPAFVVVQVFQLYEPLQ